MIYIIYVLFALLISYLYSKNTTSFAYSFLIIFFILAQPVILGKYAYKLPVLDFDLTINRLYLILFAIMLLSTKQSSNFKNQSYKSPKFIIYISILTFSIVLSLLVNIDEIYLKYVLALLTDTLTFGLFILTAKRFSDITVITAVCKSIILMMIISTLLQFPQFVGYGFFNIVDYELEAFSGFHRAMGLFHYEYQNGYMLNLALVIVYLMYGKIAILLAPLYSTGLFLAFQRMNMIIAIFNFMIVKTLQKKFIVTFAGIIILSIIISLLLTSDFLKPSSQLSQDFNLNRAFVNNTVSGRFTQYYEVARAIFSNPFGFGSELNSKRYYNLMRKINSIKSDGTPLLVHNGYLQLGIKFGIIPMLIYSFFVLRSLVYFYNKYRFFNNQIYIIPFCCLLILLIGNMSNGIYDFSFHYSLVVATIIGLFDSYNSSQNV